jgi:serine/threonine-protein kinase
MFLRDDVIEHVRSVTDEPDLGGTKYRLVRALGRGGMGSVYLVEDTELGREVALKVSTAAHWSSELSARLTREARVIAKLEHPGIVPVHDVGTLPDGRVFYVMKLVRGQRLDQHRAELRDALRLFTRVCEAVAFAHAHGVIHRDLKPENVMVGEFGEALVMDWGIATSPAAAKEKPGTVLGTPAYMAPEQARGEIDAIDERSDVYALGAILRFLAGPAAPSPVLSICAKAMSPDAARRYASANELSDEVQRFLDALPVRAHKEALSERVGRFVTRHQVVLSLLAVYLVVRLLLALMP